MAQMFAPQDQYSLEAQKIARARKMAEALQAQSQQGIDPNRMAGGWVVPIQKSEGLAKLAQALSGAFMGNKLDEREKEVGEKQRSERTATMEAFANALKGTPERSVTAPDMSGAGMTGSFDENEPARTQQTIPAQPGNQMTAYGELMKSQDPSLQQMGMRGIVDSSKPMVLGRSLVTPSGETLAVDGTWQQEQQAAREARTTEQQALREQRMQELQMRLQDQRISQQDRANLQRELQAQQIAARQDMMRLAASMRPPRQEPQPQIVQTDAGPMIMDRSGVARPITDEAGTPIKPKGLEKALPTSAAGKLMENQQNLRRAEQALELIQGRNVGSAMGDQDATGWQNYLPDFVVQRMDPKGVDTRAAIGDLGSLVIHDRSGAAVTAAEFPRLRPFIPQTTDNPETVKKKLERFVQEYRTTVEEARDFYRESGYKVPAETLRPGVDNRSGEERRGAGGPKPGDVLKGYRFKGGNPADKKNWEPV